MRKALPTPVAISIIAMITIVVGILVIWLTLRSSADLQSIAGKRSTTVVETLNSSSVSNLSHWQIPTHDQIAIDGHMGGISPIHYDISINVTNSTFIDTMVEIEFAVRKSTDRIILNLRTDGNVVNVVQLIDINKKQEICATAVRNLIDLEIVIVELNQTLLEGQRLRIKLNNRFVEARPQPPGLISDIIDQNHWSITTMLETEWTRYLFPCFDHPSLKATFQLSLERSSDTLGASNTPLINSSSIGKDRIIDLYAKTKPLPIYLFAFCVTKGFDLVPYRIDTQIEIDIFHYKHSYTLPFLERTARNTLQQMRQITGIGYDLPKLGFIIADKPGASGGIENDGLIWLNGLRDDKIDQELSNQSTPVGSLDLSKRSGYSWQSFTDLVVHEIVHLWIGNSVTVSIWPEVCLQEGLTKYLESAIQNHSLTSYSKINPLETLVFPLYQEKHVITPVCYRKGRDVFNMLSEYYGKEKIYAYVKNMVNKYLNKNANLDQWAEQLALSVNDPLAKQMLIQWFKQPGIVIVYSNLSNDSKSIHFEQELTTTAGQRRPSDEVVPFPLSVLTSNNETKSIIMQSAKQHILLQSAAEMYILDPQDSTVIYYIYEFSQYEKFAECYSNPNKSECEFVSVVKILRSIYDLCAVVQLQNNSFRQKCYGKTFENFLLALSRKVGFGPLLRECLQLLKFNC